MSALVLPFPTKCETVGYMPLICANHVAAQARDILIPNIVKAGHKDHKRLDGDEDEVVVYNCDCKGIAWFCGPFKSVHACMFIVQYEGQA